MQEHSVGLKMCYGHTDQRQTDDIDGINQDQTREHKAKSSLPSFGEGQDEGKKQNHDTHRVASFY